MYLVKSWKSKSKSKSEYLALQIYDVRHNLQVTMHCISALLKYLLIGWRLGALLKYLLIGWRLGVCPVPQ